MPRKTCVQDIVRYSGLAYSPPFINTYIKSRTQSGTSTLKRWRLTANK